MVDHRRLATEPVVLASAQETSTTLTFSDSDSSADSESQSLLVPPALISEESAEEESLIDIEIPQAAPEATPAQRLPELVKRPPAMQLHIGGAPRQHHARAFAGSFKSFDEFNCEQIVQLHIE